MSCATTAILDYEVACPRMKSQPTEDGEEELQTILKVLTNPEMPPYGLYVMYNSTSLCFKSVSFCYCFVTDSQNIPN